MNQRGFIEREGMMKELNEKLVEKTAKWLASIVENGEPYDDDTPWVEFACGEEGAEGFREEARKHFQTIEPLIRQDEREKVIGDILSNLPRKKSMLEECAYQGPPPKKWVRETAPYYDGYNKCLETLRAIIRQALKATEEKEKLKTVAEITPALSPRKKGELGL